MVDRKRNQNWVQVITNIFLSQIICKKEPKRNTENLESWKLIPSLEKEYFIRPQGKQFSRPTVRPGPVHGLLIIVSFRPNHWPYFFSQCPNSNTNIGPGSYDISRPATGSFNRNPKPFNSGPERFNKHTDKYFKANPNECGVGRYDIRKYK